MAATWPAVSLPMASVTGANVGPGSCRTVSIVTRWSASNKVSREYVDTGRNHGCCFIATLGQRCNITQQCLPHDENSLCELDSTLGIKICKCLGGFEEVNTGNGLVCTRIKSTLETSTTNVDRRVHKTRLTTSDCAPIPSDASSGAVASNRQHRGFAQLSRSSQAGLIAFSGVVLVAIVILAILAR